MEEIRFIIGRNITKLRNEKGITQAELAEHLIILTRLSQNGNVVRACLASQH